MHRYFTWTTLMLLLLSAGSCNKFETNPYEVKIPAYMRHLNERNIQQLLLMEENADDTVNILFVGDSQRFYDELQDLVSKTNSLKNIDFLVLAGDISDFGLAREFTWIYEEISKLNVPFISVIGNHDLTGRGGEVYEQMFGPKNFSFKYKGYKFLFHDTNGREYGFNGSTPDISWVSKELQDDSPKWFVGVSHVAPIDADFDQSLSLKYKDVLAAEPRFILALNGHHHDTADGFYFNDHVRYIISNSVQKRAALILTLTQGNISKTTMEY